MKSILKDYLSKRAQEMKPCLCEVTGCLMVKMIPTMLLTICSIGRMRANGQIRLQSQSERRSLLMTEIKTVSYSISNFFKIPTIVLNNYPAVILSFGFLLLVEGSE